MAVGRREKRGQAVIALTLDDAVPAEVLAKISAAITVDELCTRSNSRNRKYRSYKSYTTYRTYFVKVTLCAIWQSATSTAVSPR